MSTDQQGGISLIRVEQDRVSEIITLHNEIVSYLRMSVKKAIRIGELLSEQKACLQHGEFLPLFTATCSADGNDSAERMSTQILFDRVTQTTTSAVRSKVDESAGP